MLATLNGQAIPANHHSLMAAMQTMTQQDTLLLTEHEHEVFVRLTPDDLWFMEPGNWCNREDLSYLSQSKVRVLTASRAVLSPGLVLA